MTMSMQLQTTTIEPPAPRRSTSESHDDAGDRRWLVDSTETAPAVADLHPGAADLHRMRRLVAVQNRLLDLMADECEAGELLGGVASLLELPLVLFDCRGALLAQAGSTRRLGDPDLLWRRYVSTRRGEGPSVVDSADGRLCFHEVSMLGRVERVLVAEIPRSADPDLAEMALCYLERLLSLDVARQREELIAARRKRSRLLQDFLSTTAAAEEDVALHLQGEGIDESSVWRVVVCELSSPRPGRGAAGRRLDGQVEDRVVAAAERVAAGQKITQLVTFNGTDLVILAVAAEREPAAVRESLIALQAALQEAAKVPRVRIGCSSEREEWSHGTRALHEAQEAIVLARRRPDGIELFDDVSGRYRVIDGQSDEMLKDIYERTVGRLAEVDSREHTRLLETVAVLLDNQLSVQATASALYIHRNTLHKRLHRIERLLQVDVDRLDDVVELYLGLRAAELLGQPAWRRPVRSSLAAAGQVTA